MVFQNIKYKGDKTEGSHALKLLIVCLLFLAGSSHAQYFKVTSFSNDILYGKGSKLPKFSKAHAEMIADSINVDIINEIPISEPNTEVIGTSVSSVEYNVTRNDNVALCVAVSYEACAAYCESGTDYFAYDSKTAARIKPRQLFDQEGLNALMDTLTYLKFKRIDSFTLVLQSMLKLGISNNNIDVERDTLALQMYQDCKEYRLDSTSVDYIRFILREEAFDFVVDRCSAHANRASDDLWEFRFSFDARGWRRYLTDYGKYIFQL